MISKEYILALLKVKGLGRKTVRSIIENTTLSIESPIDAIEVLRKAHLSNRRVVVPSLQEFSEAVDKSERLIEASFRENTQVITFLDDKFPKPLKKIPDSPVVIYVKGMLGSLINEDAIAIIGTREPTEYGRRVAFRFGSVFAENSFVVVSGLATGCDSEAHRGCLKAEGQTIAVLAGGVDHIYPKQNESLAREIVDSGGCLLSEYETGTRPFKSNFVERDRLQSGLSKAVLVVETDVKGGTMHTVGFAKEQKRLVACFSNHPESLRHHPKVQGNKKLLSEGTATGLATADDISNFIHFMRGEPTKPATKKRTRKKKIPTQQNENQLEPTPSTPERRTRKKKLPSIQTESLVEQTQLAPQKRTRRKKAPPAHTENQFDLGF